MARDTAKANKILLLVSPVRHHHRSNRHPLHYCAYSSNLAATGIPACPKLIVALLNEYEDVGDKSSNRIRRKHERKRKYDASMLASHISDKDTKDTKDRKFTGSRT